MGGREGFEMEEASDQNLNNKYYSIGIHFMYYCNVVKNCMRYKIYPGSQPWTLKLPVSTKLRVLPAVRFYVSTVLERV